MTLVKGYEYTKLVNRYAYNKGRFKQMKSSVTKKITAIVSIIVFFSVSMLAVVNYRSSYREVLQAAGIELTGCANITTGIIDASALFNLVNGDDSYLDQIEQEIEWTINHKPIFETHYILSLDGTVLAGDSHFREQGFQAGDQFKISEEAIEHVMMGHTFYTDVYEFGGMERVTGYAPIFRDHDPQNEVIAINTIDFEGSIIPTRTWEMAKPTLLIGLFIPFIAAAITFFIVRRITKPIQPIIEHVNQVADGELNISKLNIQTKDELGQLSNDVNKMAASLRTVIQGVASTSEQIAATSEQLYASAEDTNSSTDTVHRAINEVAIGAEKQSQSTQQANQNLNTMAERINQMSNQVDQATSASNHADHVSQQGRQVVEQTMDQMSHIKENTLQINSITSELNEKAKKIDYIITMITNISEQTNLLALNASIEAARAGEHGKGFSVVANEVRKLAEQTKEATDQVATLVSEIQIQASQSVTQVSQGQVSVEQGFDLIKRTNESFVTISTSTAEVASKLNQLTKDITIFKQQMRELVEQVNEITNIATLSATNIDQIATTGDEQKEMMQDVFEASKELATIAEQLQSTIEQFNY